MPEQELWLTRLFNDYLAGPAASVLTMFHVKVEDPAHPWANWMAYELLVAAIIVVLVAVLRSRLSVDKPGKLQHIFEWLYEFVQGTTDEIGIHHAPKYVPFFFSVGFFILCMNLIGIIPTFDSPTSTPAVPLGLAVCTFIYYHVMGFKENGIRYPLQFFGPVRWLAWLMVVLELISHAARMLSLTVRLYGNMFAGETVTNIFLNLTLTRLIAPAAFMALHVFVAFIQAYVFMLLAIIYVSQATSHEH